MNRLIRNKYQNYFYVLVLMSLIGCASGTDEQYPKWSDEERADIHVKLGLGYLKNNQYKTAGQEFDYAIEIFPDSDQAYHGKALLYSQLGNMLNARIYFRRAIDINEDNFLAVNDYGIYLCNQGDVQSGLKQLNRISDNTSNQYAMMTRFGLGVCYFQANQYPQAEKFLRSVLQVEPKLYQALYPMAVIAFQNQDYLSARGFIERYFALKQPSEQALSLATNIEKKLLNDDKANTYQDLLIELYPSSSFIQESN